MWVLLGNVQYESHNEFYAVWKKKPHLNTLKQLLPDKRMNFKQLKIQGFTTDQWGEQFTLTKVKLGVLYP